MTDARPSSPLKVIDYIRFQLDQLNSRNAQHDFEHLCRHFAREAIAPNILPATGPVAAGGDQGRDFETFTSFIPPPNTSLFFGRYESKSLIFACSIQKDNLRGKIKSDVESIIQGQKLDVIYFFSNQNVAVSLRHEIQKWCMDEHQISLEIIDAQTLSEQLAQPKMFWIAEEYLKIPAEIYPKSSSSDHPYENAKSAWLGINRHPHTFADFVEIKTALRIATRNDYAKPDLSSWIEIMKKFNATENTNELRRRSIYEVCVAALRGQHNLTPYRKLVELYFSNWASSADSTELRDATILLSYCSTAVLLGEFEVDVTSLHTWSKTLVQHLNKVIAATSNPNILTELLFTRAHAAQLQFAKSKSPQFDFDEVFKWWNRVVRSAKKAQLFPVEDFADLLTKVAPYVGNNEQFPPLMRKVEELLEARSRGYLIAEKCQDRAIELLKAGKTLNAIDELHRAKVRWFTGDTLRGSLLSLLSLSQCYLTLGLCYAAKYHALGAVFLIHQSNDDDIRSLFPSALLQLCTCEYEAGEWMTFSEHFPLFLNVHYQHEKSPDDWSEGKIQQMLFHFLVTKSLAKAMGGPEAMEKVEAPLRSLQMPDDLREEILRPPLQLDKYENMAVGEILSTTTEELWCYPFADCGPQRAYRWKALGIDWFAFTNNTISDIPFAEEFVAVLQIIIADFARTDLCLLPTSVDLELEVCDSVSFEIKELPDNTRMTFKISVPRIENDVHMAALETEKEVVGVASTILFWCSMLPDSELKKKLAAAFQNELPYKTFMVRPYWELFMQLVSKKEFDGRRKEEIGAFDRRTVPQRESAEIGWINGPGYGYSRKKSHEFIKNRYRRAIMPIRQTLIRLRASPRFHQWITKLRGEGYLDWQILLFISNVVMNYRVHLIQPVFQPGQTELYKEIMSREESDADPKFPEEQLYSPESEMSKFAAWGAVTKTWGLQIRRATPDIAAIERFMNVRYFQSTDDIPHDDIFAFLQHK